MGRLHRVRTIKRAIRWGRCVRWEVFGYRLVETAFAGLFTILTTGFEAGGTYKFSAVQTILIVGVPLLVVFRNFFTESRTDAERRLRGLRGYRDADGPSS